MRCGDADACLLFIFDLLTAGWRSGPDVRSTARWSREVLREFARCRHQALDRALLRPTASYAGDPEECRRADGSPQEPGIGNVFDGSGDRAAFAGAGGRSRGA